MPQRCRGPLRLASYHQMTRGAARRKGESRSDTGHHYMQLVTDALVTHQPTEHRKVRETQRGCINIFCTTAPIHTRQTTRALLSPPTSYLSKTWLGNQNPGSPGASSFHQQHQVAQRCGHVARNALRIAHAQCTQAQRVRIVLNILCDTIHCTHVCRHGSCKFISLSTCTAPTKPLGEWRAVKKTLCPDADVRACFPCRRHAARRCGRSNVPVM